MNPAPRSPRITVGVPVYNGERYLAKALESLLSQTVGDMVILVGDNASTDATADIAREYAARDSRVRHIRHDRNLGAARNYSVLCEMAQTEFFRWLAADDCSAPRFHEACLETLARNPDAVLAYPRIMMIDAQGRNLEEYHEGLHLPHERPSERLFALLIYTSITQVPKPADLAILLIPSTAVPESLTACGEHGIQTVIVASGGFREIGPAGAVWEEQCLNNSKKIPNTHVGTKLCGSYQHSLAS